MKGFTTENGYMGFVDGDYMLFASEEDYLEYFYDIEEDDDWGLAA